MAEIASYCVEPPFLDTFSCLFFLVWTRDLFAWHPPATTAATSLCTFSLFLSFFSSCRLGKRWIKCVGGKGERVLFSASAKEKEEERDTHARDDSGNLGTADTARAQ
nr:hypothetical protein [Pandoravirus aubagnensis]